MNMRDRATIVGKLTSGREYLIVPMKPVAYLGPRFNGYVVWPKRPVRERDYDGIISYVPVHGGVTYAHEDETGEMVYGFDTAHGHSNRFPINDPEWIKEQCEVLDRAIAVASEVELKYLRCITNEGKAKWAQKVRNVAPDEELGMSARLNVLRGEL